MRMLKSNLLGLISSFSKYYFKTCTLKFASLSLHVFTALEFDSNLVHLTFKNSKATWP